MGQNAGPMSNINVAGRDFAVDPTVDTTRDLGGKNVTYLPNGDGKTARKSTEIKLWVMGGIPVVIDDAKGDQEFLKNLRTAVPLEDVAITGTYVDGTVYQAMGLPTGESSYSTQSASEVTDFTGPGELQKQ